MDDISIYTYDDDKPLREIYRTIFDKENGGETISHKEDAKKLQAYLLEILPSYDQERVYGSDIKKLFQWYNLLHKAGELKVEETKEETPAAETTDEAVKKAPAKKLHLKKLQKKRRLLKLHLKQVQLKKLLLLKQVLAEENNNTKKQLRSSIWRPFFMSENEKIHSNRF